MDRSLQGPQPREDGLTEFPVHPNYVGEDVPEFRKWFQRDDFQKEGTVRYLNEREREERRLYLQGNELVFADGTVPSGGYIFVVDRNGHLIASKSEAYVIHHSSLAGGEPVLMAGEMQFDQRGQLTGIENSSGHFRPNAQAFEHFLAALRDGGVHLSYAEAPVIAAFQDELGGAVMKKVAPNLLEDIQSLRAGPAMMVKDLTAPRPKFERRTDPGQAPGQSRDYKTDPIAPSDGPAAGEQRNYKTDPIAPSDSQVPGERRNYKSGSVPPSGDQAADGRRDAETDPVEPSDTQVPGERRNYKWGSVAPTGGDQPAGAGDVEQRDQEPSGGETAANVERLHEGIARFADWTGNRRTPRFVASMQRYLLAEFRLAA